MPELIRRNIHTYPFKYQNVNTNDFFRPELGAIYIHIPFCSTKCHFCEYAVMVNASEDLKAAYVDALCEEIRAFPRNPAFPGFVIDSVYFGGGTPGLLDINSLQYILDTCRNVFNITETAEICIEFDPACVEEEKLEQLYNLGFNRLSLGVQSFDRQLIAEANRPHTLEQIYSALDIVCRSKISHVNIDLMYPLFGLTIEKWVDTLTQAIAFKPACITAYPLEVWPKTVYHTQLSAKGLKLPDIATELVMAETALEMLTEAGFKNGSTSGYYHPERANRYSRFLEFYWRTWPMLGFGVSSKTVIYNHLYTNIRPVKTYIDRINNKNSVIDFGTRMTKRQEMHRVMIRGLKIGNVRSSEFFERFGVDMKTIFSDQIEDLVKDGFLLYDETGIHLTRKGLLYSNTVWERFYTKDDLRPPRENEIQYGISELVRN